MVRPTVGERQDPGLTAAERSDRRRAQFVGLAAAIAVVAAVWAVVGSASLLPELSSNSDEGLYLLQADALGEGMLAPLAPDEDAEAFRPWFSAIRDDRFVLKYTPVHAAVLAASTAASGSPRPALGLIAGSLVLVVVWLAREVGAGRRAALLAGAAIATAPLTVQTSITFLSYGTSAALLCGAGAAVLRARRVGRPWVAVAGGLAAGTALFARPYDAVLFGIAVAVGLVVLGRRDAPRLRPTVLVGSVALGAALPVALMLGFNHEMTGDALHLPFRLLEPRDAPGFGLRRSVPNEPGLDYSPADAAASFGRNLQLVTVWGAGGTLGAVLALSTLVRQRLRAGVVLLTVIIVWNLGYALFYGSYIAAFVWDGALFLGPYYYLPVLAVLAVAVGVAIDDLLRWRPALGVGAASAGLVLGLLVVGPRLSEQAERSQAREDVAAAVRTGVSEPAVVFVPPLYGPYLQNPFSFLRNTPTLDGPVVYALDRGDRLNADILEMFPDRVGYRLAIATWSDQPGFRPDVDLVPT